MPQLKTTTETDVGLVSIGSKVYWKYPEDCDRRKEGTVEAYNADPIGLYNKFRYPYVIRWDDGVKDVYSPHDFSTTPISHDNCGVCKAQI